MRREGIKKRFSGKNFWNLQTSFKGGSKER
jgi:hypothetical protein